MNHLSLYSQGITQTALECDFPITEISQIAEQESWRKEINRPIYHVHKWWATRLGSVFRAVILGALISSNEEIWEQFYKTHNLQNKIVLDPFMGSGTTLGEALKLGAKAVGCDINPISTFMVRQAFSTVSEAQLYAAFEKLKINIASKIKHYYQTRAPKTGKLIPALYYFWVKTVKTPQDEVIPLFSRYVFAQDAYPKKKPLAQILCPECWSIIKDRYDATCLHCPHCNYRFNPQKGPVNGQYVTDKNGQRHKIKELLFQDSGPSTNRMYAIMALQDDGQKIYLPIRTEDLALYNSACDHLVNEILPLPNMFVRPGYNTNQARGYNYTQWRDFFNSRQLLCLGLLLREILKIENHAIQEQMLCLFSGTLEFNNLFCSFKGEGTGAVRHLFSHHILKPQRTPLENSVWGTEKSSGTFSTLFNTRLLRAKCYLKHPFEIAFKHDLFGKSTSTHKILASQPIRTNYVDSWDELLAAQKGLLVFNGDSAKLPLPNNSIDAVITDPPYFDFVNYSELSDFFFAWLSPILRDRYPWMASENSFNEGEVQHKDPRIFSYQLTSVFSEACRVLKDDGVLAFSFHHSRTEGWAAIYEAMNKAGLVLVAVYPVYAELRVATPKTTTKEPISFDIILVCRKKSFAIRPSLASENIINTTGKLLSRLQAAGLSPTSGDRFVISAAQTLISHTMNNLSFEEIKVKLDALRKEN